MRNNEKAQTWKKQSRSLGSGARLHGNELSYGPPKDKQEMTSLLRAAVERGITFFDTAEARIRCLTPLIQLVFLEPALPSSQEPALHLTLTRWGRL